MFKPMLAGKAPAFDQIKYPVLATPKLDGIRCVIIEGKAKSRSLKPIPNEYVRAMLERNSDYINICDGELIIEGKQFNEISSAIMSFSGTPDFNFIIFDAVEIGVSYIDRLNWLGEKKNLPSFCKLLLSQIIRNAEELEEYEAQKLSEGYEGVIIRDPYGPYKFGRSTTKEGYMLKIKRFEDGEAKIVGFEELQHNENEAFVGELGQTKRSTCQYGQVAGGTLGALIVQDIKTGVLFNIGTGFTAELRSDIWKHRDYYFSKIAKYKCQPHGRVEKPRSPVFLGIRSILDL